MAKIYSYDTIKEKVSCFDLLRHEGIEVNSENRCVAVWRGGKHANVHVSDKAWHDFKTKDGGSVIDLCAIIRFGGDAMRASQYIGEAFNLEPSGTTRARTTRGTSLQEKGFRNTARYDYTDEVGKLVFSVFRWEKENEDGTKEKTFQQCTPGSDRIAPGTPKLPYNLVAVVNTDTVCIVEGEKDVETLRGWGIVGSCNSGGSGNFHKDLVKWFTGKNIVILPDNDEAGEKHCRVVQALLKPVAKTLKVVRLSSIPKGDVTDWMEREGGNGTTLLEKISDAPIDNEEVDAPDVALAKQANETPFANYILQKVDGKDVVIPRTQGDMVEECFVRFLGYPRKIMSDLFDWNRDLARVDFIGNSNALFAWIGLKSKRPVDWRRGDALMTQGQFYEAVLMEAKRYESIASAPFWPMRLDVFATYGKLPPPDPTHRAFETFCAFFNPCDSANEMMLRAFVMAPIYYRPGADRPMWIVDTIDQQGSGKSSLVTMTSYLYGEDCIKVEMKQLKAEAQQVVRRLISTDARKKRIALFDNVVGEINSQELADFVTSSHFSGLAPYGHSEETRPNDLTFVITVNNATVNADIAARCYTVRLARPKSYDGKWKSEVMKFVDDNRLQIFADMIHLIENNVVRDSRARNSRFAQFDSDILFAACGSEDNIRTVDAVIKGSNEDSNVDYDHGVEFFDLFTMTIASRVDGDVMRKKSARTASIEELRSLVDTGKPMFIRNSDIDWMLANSDGPMRTWHTRDVLSLIKNGYVEGFDTKVTRPNNAPRSFDGDALPKTSGLLYRGDFRSDGHLEAQVVRRVQHGRESYFDVIGTASFKVSASTYGGSNVSQAPVRTDNCATDVEINGSEAPSVPRPMTMKEKMLAAARAANTTIKARNDDAADGAVKGYSVADEPDFAEANL